MSRLWTPPGSRSGLGLDQSALARLIPRARFGLSLAWAVILAFLASLIWLMGASAQKAADRSGEPNLSSSLSGLGPAHWMSVASGEDRGDLAAKSFLEVSSREGRWRLGWGEWAALRPLPPGSERRLELSLSASGSAYRGPKARLGLVTNIPPRLWRQTPRGIVIDSSLAQAGLTARLAWVDRASGEARLAPKGDYQCGGGDRLCAVALLSSPASKPARLPASLFGWRALALLWLCVGALALWRSPARVFIRALLAFISPKAAARMALPLSAGRALGERL